LLTTTAAALLRLFYFYFPANATGRQVWSVNIIRRATVAAIGIEIGGRSVIMTAVVPLPTSLVYIVGMSPRPENNRKKLNCLLTSWVRLIHFTSLCLDLNENAFAES